MESGVGPKSIVRRPGDGAGWSWVVQGYHCGDHAAPWPGQFSFSVSNRGLNLAAPQRCHCSLYKAMSSPTTTTWAPCSTRPATRQCWLPRHRSHLLIPPLFFLLKRCWQEKQALLWYRHCCLSDVNCLSDTGVILFWKGLRILGKQMTVGKIRWRCQNSVREWVTSSDMVLRQ